MKTRQANDSGKRVLVTGAAKGIGAAIVRLCLEARHQVVAVDIDESGLSQLRAQLPGIEIARLDVTLADPDLYTRDSAKAQRLVLERGQKAKALAEAEEAWLAATEAFEAAEAAA